MTSELLARISFKPVVDDYLAVHALALTKATSDHRWRARFVLCVASWSATAVSLLTAGALSIQSAVTGVVCSLVFILVFTVKMWPDPERAARQTYNPTQNPHLLKQRTVQLEELGIRVFTDMSDYWLNWAIIHRVILTEQHLFMASKSMMVFVPARAFAGHGEFMDFARIAQARYTPKVEETNVRGFEVVMKNASKDDNQGES